MSDYTELVKALRCCGNDGCHKCPYQKHIHEKFCWVIAMKDAAAAIETLQADQKKTVTQIFCEEQMAWEGRCKDLMKQNSELQAEVDALKHDIARYVQMNTDLLNEPPQVGKAGNQYTLIEPKNKRYPLRCPKCGTVVGLMEVQE